MGAAVAASGGGTVWARTEERGLVQDGSVFLCRAPPPLSQGPLTGSPELMDIFLPPLLSLGLWAKSGSASARLSTAMARKTLSRMFKGAA